MVKQQFATSALQIWFISRGCKINYTLLCLRKRQEFSHLSRNSSLLYLSCADDSVDCFCLIGQLPNDLIRARARLAQKASVANLKTSAEGHKWRTSTFVCILLYITNAPGVFFQKLKPEDQETKIESLRCKLSMLFAQTYFGMCFCMQLV